MFETTELEAARRVVEVAKRYRDRMFGATITPADKSELIDAVDIYEAVVETRTEAEIERVDPQAHFRQEIADRIESRWKRWRAAERRRKAKQRRAEDAILVQQVVNAYSGQD